jgi:hypothetical protein
VLLYYFFTSSAGLDRFQIDQLFAAASRVRPDVLLISCMDQPIASLRTAVAELQGRLGPDVRVELLEFQPDALGAPQNISRTLGQPGRY